MKTTYTEAREVFLSYCRTKNLTPSTITWYKHRLGALINFLEANNPGILPNQTTVREIRDFVSYLLDTVSVTTVNKTLTALTTFFTFLVEESLIEKSPMERIEQVRGPKLLIRAFSNEQVKSLLSAPVSRRFSGIRDRALMILLFDTGLRISEVINLTDEDIDWLNGTVRVMGKGRKERVVPFGQQARKSLVQYMERRGDIEGSNRVFISELGDPMSVKVAQDNISRYGRESSISGVRCSPHTFRHTFAKNWILNGGDPFSLQQILGHTTMDMVRRYVNLANSDLQNAHRVYSPLDRLLGSEEPQTGRKTRKRLR